MENLEILAEITLPGYHLAVVFPSILGNLSNSTAAQEPIQFDTGGTPLPPIPLRSRS